MRFSSTMDSLIKEVRFLKSALMALIGLCACLTVTVMVLFEKEPLIVERSSRGLELLTIQPNLKSESDLESAVKLMMKARFDTDSVSPEVFINRSQLELKEFEQKEMKSKNMAQAVIVRSVKFEKGEAQVLFDRVFSVGNVRSALMTEAKITFEEAEPNELNPYGLKLSSVTPNANKKAGEK